MDNITKLLFVSGFLVLLLAVSYAWNLHVDLNRPIGTPKTLTDTSDNVRPLDCGELPGYRLESVSAYRCTYVKGN